MLCDSRPTRGSNIIESLESWLMSESIKDTERWILFLFLVSSSRAYAVNNQNLAFKINYTPKLPWYAVSWQQQKRTTKPYNSDIKCQYNYESYDQHCIFSKKNIASLRISVAKLSKFHLPHLVTFVNKLVVFFFSSYKMFCKMLFVCVLR